MSLIEAVQGELPATLSPPPIDAVRPRRCGRRGCVAGAGSGLLFQGHGVRQVLIVLPGRHGQGVARMVRIVVRRFRCKQCGATVMAYPRGVVPWHLYSLIAIVAAWWLSKTPHPKADNHQVLVPYSPDMERLIKRGYKAKQRPSGHNVTEKWGKDQGGAICSNLFTYGNNDSNGFYLKRCQEAGIKPHPVRFPPQLPEFFINFLTDAGDLVFDIFGGSNTTGATAERLGRRWLICEQNEDYLKGSRFRFEVDDTPINGEVRGQAILFPLSAAPGK